MSSKHSGEIIRDSDASLLAPAGSDGGFEKSNSLDFDAHRDVWVR